MPLTSVQNPVLKSIRRAATTGRPTEEGFVVAEGPHLLGEALRSRWQVQQVFCTEASFQKHGELLRSCRAKVTQVSARALSSSSAEETSQEILSLLRPREWAWTELLDKPALLVVLDGIQDPGNAGTIVRSAEAFGATGAVFLTGSTRISNGKFLRASAGSIFRLPFLESISPALLLERASSAGVDVLSLDMRRSSSIARAPLHHPCALVVGSEGSGVSAEILESSRAISIPTRKVESLNAAVACSLALYEAFRQRNPA